MTQGPLTRGDVDALVARVPEWAGAHVALAPLHGGITNTNYVASVNGHRYVVRMPGERTELLGIDRANEAEAARRAAELGIGPAVAGVLPHFGTLITELVPRSSPRATPVHRPAAARSSACSAAFTRVDRSAGAFPIHRVVEWHARDAASYGVIPPPAYDRLHQQSRRIEAAFARSPQPLVPCHNDLLPGNVLFGETDDGVWLLDFEYAGMNERVLRPGQPQRELRPRPALPTRTLLHLYFGGVTSSRGRGCS